MLADPDAPRQPDRRVDRLPDLLRGRLVGSRKLPPPDAHPAVRADRCRAGRALRAAGSRSGTHRRRPVPRRGRHLRAVQGTRDRAGAGSRRRVQRRRGGRADRAVLRGDADPDGRRRPRQVRTAAAGRDGDRQAGAAGGRVQERLPRRADVPGHLRLGLRRSGAQPVAPGHPRGRADRRGHGRFPDGPLQGAVHGHPADRRDAPGQHRADGADRAGGRGRADRPAIHPGRDRGTTGGRPGGEGQPDGFLSRIGSGGRGVSRHVGDPAAPRPRYALCERGEGR